MKYIYVYIYAEEKVKKERYQDGDSSQLTVVISEWCDYGRLLFPLCLPDQSDMFMIYMDYFCNQEKQ